VHRRSPIASPSASARLLVLAMVVACGHGAEPSTRAAPAQAGVRATAVIDSHVHLAFWPVADELAAAGVVAAVDLGAPFEGGATAGPLRLVEATPLLTRPGGYPMNEWDPGGFGLGCDEAACVEAVIARAATRGRRVVKLALGPDGLDATLVPVAVAAAHRRGMKVAAHAMSELEVRLAADSGVDVLAHTPLGQVSDETVAAWGRDQRAVISTLAAFGGKPLAVENLRRLRAAGATVLYGTDLGNSRVAAVDPEELRLLAAAGLDGAAVVAAMTTVPAAYWGIDLAADTYVRLARDPAVDPAGYAAPLEVWIAGKQLR